MKNKVTFLGNVRKVNGSKVLVEISSELPSASPIIDGKVYRLGQIGSFVRIPLGFLNLYGVVSMVGASEMDLPDDKKELQVDKGQRWLEVQLVGESYGKKVFKRGISVFPTLDDEVHIVTENEYSIIFGETGSSLIKIGSHVVADGIPAHIDIDKLVTRHSAIVGSTGSGKSNTVAGILKSLTKDSYPNSRTVVIDPHGEYGAALKEHAKIMSIGDEESPLFVPYWALSFDELAWFLVDKQNSGDTMQDMALRDKIFEEKKKFCEESDSIKMNEITSDSPIPFDIKKVWYDLYEKEHATLNERNNWESIAYEEDDQGNELMGSLEEVIPPKFKPPGNGSASPFRSTYGKNLSSYLNKIMGRLKDKRFEFLLDPGEFNGKDKDLHNLLEQWIDHDKPITVLDLGGVPFEIMDLIVGVVTRIIYEGMYWGRNIPGIGRQRPLLIVYEEAHTYLPKGGKSQFVTGYAGHAVRRVFKEGRKYGVGAMVVSQRPSELDETILSQCGTFFSLRLSNGNDQGIIKSTVPDSFTGLLELLPALRTGEALILGEAVKIPSRVRIPLVEPRPMSDDPKPSKLWGKDKIKDPDYEKAVIGWRRQFLNINRGD